MITIILNILNIKLLIDNLLINILNKNTRFSLVYLAFGANLKNKTTNIKKSIKILHNNGVFVYKLSQFYKNKPLLPDNFPEWMSLYQKNACKKLYFVNCVGLFYTKKSPFKLLDLIQKIEKKLGKKKLGYWLPRLIDIDIILYQNIKIKSKSLQIPHKHYKKRSFVLKPLIQIKSKL